MAVEEIDPNEVVRYIYLVGSSISVIGNVLVLLSFALVPALRKHPVNLIFWAQITASIFTLKFLIFSVTDYTNGSNGLCLLDAILGQFSVLASLNWSFIISVNFFISLRNPFSNTVGYVKVYHLYCWSLAVISVIVMVAAHEWGYMSDGTCWIPGAQNAYRLLLFGPLLIYLIVNTFILFYSFFAFRSLPLPLNHRRWLLYRSVMFIFIFVISWIGPIAHRIGEWFGGETFEESNWGEFLLYADSMGLSTQTFLTSLLWLSFPDFSLGISGLKRLFFSFILPRGNSSARRSVVNKSTGSIDEQQSTLLALHTQIDPSLILRRNLMKCILKGISKSIETLEDNIEREQYEYPLELPSSQFFVSASDSIDADSRGDKDSSVHIFKDYYPLVFYELRKIFSIETESYLRSLSEEQLERTVLNKFSEGRSGSFFWFSYDKQYIIKSVTKAELNVLRKILPFYYEHNNEAKSAVILRVYGVHSIRQVEGKKEYIMVMQNAFPPATRIHERFDIKGSWIKRTVGKRKQNMDVLKMDCDLNRTLAIGNAKKTEIIEQIAKDTQMLASLNIMDYSLLIGIHKRNSQSFEVLQDLTQSNELLPREVDFSEPDSVVAEPPVEDTCNQVLSSDGSEIYFFSIIDITQRYDIGKKMERFFKVYCLRRDRKGISVVPPQEYRERFLARVESLLE